MAVAPERSDREQRFKRFGLGWQFRPPDAPVVMTFTSVSEKRGEVRAEVHVQTLDGGHMLRRYLNLMGSRSMDELVKDLNKADGGAQFPWPKILESATESIINALRVGPDAESFGGMKDRPPGISWLCEGLVMANVPNVWLAAASTGKSTFAALLALYHALGEPFLGRPTTKGIALYLDWESTGDDLAEKLWLGSRWLGLEAVPHGIHRLPMRGPASMYAAAIANRIDSLGATLVIWDGVQAAGGPVGQYTSYESVAMDLEALVALLPPTTHVLLDHVTGDDLKAGAVPLKARGGTRKVEWARNQWSLILDRDAHTSKRHVVGWTHTKINRSDYLQPFGVEVVHRPDELGFKLLAEAEVEPLREKMPAWRQLLGVLQQAGRPLSNRAAADLWKGKTDKKDVDLVRALVNQRPQVFTRNADGTFEPHWKLKQARGSHDVNAEAGAGYPADDTERPHLTVVETQAELEEADDGFDLPW
jgi:hypothetical protein